MAKSEILLESGTNELEIIVFGVGRGRYGINVAKVREIVPMPHITVPPGLPRGMRGMFELRKQMIPLIDLSEFLNVEPNADEEQRVAIVTEFNRYASAFLADSVERIFRISWQDIDPMPPVDSDHQSFFTATTIIEGHVVLMVDFESVLSAVDPAKSLMVTKVENDGSVNREACRVFVVDDSETVRAVMAKTLIDSGYTQTQQFINGQACWDYIVKQFETTGKNCCDLLITDIEMPRMDGLHLCKRVKDHPKMSQVPVILFSSLITDDTLHKGEQVGADGQINKPMIAQLVNVADEWIRKRSQ